MLAIKLKPVGKKHQRTFRVVVTEKKSKLRGRYAEDLGFFNPHTNSFSINKEKAVQWMKNGAIPTDSVHNILIRAGAIKGKKIAVHSKSKKPPVAETVQAEPAGQTAAATEAPAQTEIPAPESIEDQKTPSEENQA